MWRALGLALSAMMSAAVFLSACGGSGKPPQRGVLERNVSSWNFRRYQAVLDVEVWVPKNAGAAHTASYVRGDAEKLGRLEDADIVSAFVTRYQSNRGIARALVKFARRLAQESGYAVEERTIEGTRLIFVKGSGESWAMWPAPRHVIKIGGRGLNKIPPSVVEAYAERYPSRLPSGALEGRLPTGPDDEPADPSEPFDPQKPRPEWKN